MYFAMWEDRVLKSYLKNYQHYTSALRIYSWSQYHSQTTRSTQTVVLENTLENRVITSNLK